MTIKLVAKSRGGRQLIGLSGDIFVAALKRVERVLTSDRDVRVNLIRTSDPDISRYMGGASGWTRSADTMDIHINPKTPTWKEATKRSFIHEFNHLVRHQRFEKPSREYSLMDTIASEGLAQCFEKKVCGTLPPYAKAISLGQARVAWLKLKPHLYESNNTLYRRAFFAVKDPEFPHWSGYTLSYLVVRQRMSGLPFEWSRIMQEKSHVIVGRGLG